MKPASANLIATCATLICGAGVTPAIAAAPETQTLAQDLEQVRSSGRLLSALWTRRSNTYTLQLVFPDPMADWLKARMPTLNGEQAPAAAPDAATGTMSKPAISSREQIEETKVWLLAADGSATSPLSPVRKPVTMSGPNVVIANLRYFGQTPFEVQYNIPLAAGQNAIAVAVMLDGKLYIDKLVPLEAASQ